MKFAELKGAIFDVDDTLLDNFPHGDGVSLHDRSRLEAAHIVGKRHGSVGLQQMTLQQADQAFVNAIEHSLRGAVWQMLRMAGEVMTEDIEDDNPLLQEMMALKENIHENLLRTEGAEKPGAILFVSTMAERGLRDRLAVASTAPRRDIDIFFEMTGLQKVFATDRIISREDLMHPKPHPEAYDKAFAALGLPEAARECVIVFEDDPRGIMSAKAAGLYTCAITGVRYDRKALAALPVAPDLIADSYAEFAQVLELPTS